MNTGWLFVKYASEEIEKHVQFKKAVAGDAGFDLYHASNETLTVAPFKSLMINAGISVKLPEDCCALVYPRSSTFRKRGLFVVPGLIDSGYTGPIYTFVWHPNLDNVDRPILIEPWERLSQLLIIPIPSIVVKKVDELPKTERGNNGFGSTGR